MKVVIFTLVLDGMPSITWHLPMLNWLRCDWEWRIVHGVADNVSDTSWCKKIPARLSVDGTTEYLRTLQGHPRIKIYERELWHGKTEMCNAALEGLGHCLLIQMDSDELWQHWQIERLENYCRQTRTDFDCVRLSMRYFVGPNIVTIGENCYGNNPGEWLRAWNFTPGRKFLRHEPPSLSGVGTLIDRSITVALGIVPDHYAYVFEHQVAFKEKYYGYTDAVKHWRRLQEWTEPWPVKLQDFLPWVDSKARATILHTAT